MRNALLPEFLVLLLSLRNACEIKGKWDIVGIWYVKKTFKDFFIV
jgi:hypothetical protein